MPNIKLDLDEFKIKAIPHIAKLRVVIDGLKNNANLSRFTDEERRKEVRKALLSPTRGVMEFLRNYLQVEWAKVDAIRGQMDRACQPPAEFTPESLRELRDNLKGVEEKDRMDLVRRGMSGRAGYFHAVISDPSDSLSEKILDDLRREYLKMKGSPLLEEEVTALNDYALMEAMGKELSGITNQLITDSGFPYPLKLDERWVTRPANQAEEMIRAYVESPNRSKIVGLEPEGDDED